VIHRDSCPVAPGQGRESPVPRDSLPDERDVRAWAGTPAAATLVGFDDLEELW